MPAINAPSIEPVHTDTTSSLSPEHVVRPPLSAIAAAPLMRQIEGVRLWALSFAVWSVVAVLGVAESKAYAAAGGYQSPALYLLFTWSFSYAFPMALLTPVIWSLSGRLSHSRIGRWKALLLHVPSGLLFAGAGALMTVSINLLLPWSRQHVVSTLRLQATDLFLGNLPRYFLVAAISQAVLYYNQFHERATATSHLEAQLAEAKLSALKIQLQPHFIFNVLNAITTLTRRDPALSEKMTLQLAELLRMSLHTGDAQEVPLSQELRLLECYLRIQQTRFAHRLRVDFNVDLSLMDAAVPHLLLQPLVENAIRHGLSPRLETGRVSISAQVEDRQLVLAIQDDGVGLPPAANGSVRVGVGLRNTKARLRQLYGENFKFKLGNAPGGGCLVSIRIPLRMVRPEEGVKHANACVDRG